MLQVRTQTGPAFPWPALLLGMGTCFLAADESLHWRIFSTSGHFHSITSEVWSHLFQSAHRWTHFPPDELSHGLQTNWTAVLDTFIWTHAVIYLLSHPKLPHMSPQALVGHRLAKDAGAFPWTPQPHATSVLGLGHDETKVLNPPLWDLRPHGAPPGFGEAIHDSATWWKTSTLRTLASRGNSLQWLQCSRAPQVWTHRFDPRSFGQAAASCALWLLVCVAGPSEATSCVRFSLSFLMFNVWIVRGAASLGTLVSASLVTLSRTIQQRLRTGRISWQMPVQSCKDRNSDPWMER